MVWIIIIGEGFYFTGPPMYTHRFLDYTTVLLMCTAGRRTFQTKLLSVLSANTSISWAQFLVDQSYKLWLFSLCSNTLLHSTYINCYVCILRFELADSTI